MSTCTLMLLSFASAGPDWANNPGGSGIVSILTDGSDSSYEELAANVGAETCKLNLTAPASDVQTVTAAQLSIRLASDNSKATPTCNVEIFQSNGTTGLTNNPAVTVATSPTTQTVTFSLSGSQTKAAWTSSLIVVTGETDQGSSTSLRVYELGPITLTYTPVANFSPIPSSGDGAGARDGAVGLKRFYEGARYVYRKSQQLFLPERRIWTPAQEARRPRPALI